MRSITCSPQTAHLASPAVVLNHQNPQEELPRQAHKWWLGASLKVSLVDSDPELKSNFEGQAV